MPLPTRVQLHSPRQTEVLRRWGVVACHAVDQTTLGASLSGLLEFEDAPPLPLEDLVDWLVAEAEPLERLVSDAIALAEVAEAAHRRNDRWPHGLADVLRDIADLMEMHQAREPVAYAVALKGERTSAQIVRRMLAEHRCIRRRLATVRESTAGLQAPHQACATWRLLYVLCTKIDSDLERRMAMEEGRIYAPMLRNRTEV